MGKNTALAVKQQDHDWTQEELETLWDTGKRPGQAKSHSTNRRLRKSSVRQKYEGFKQQNPWIVDEVARIARIVRASGVKQWGVKAAIEIIRWNYMMGYSDAIVVEGEPRNIAINNLIAPYLSREVMLAHPDLDGFFETRKLSHE